MKFDTIIIGGGLSGLVAGIKLAQHRRTVAIISTGQSALHFCSGSFGLLGKINGNTVEYPLAAIGALQPSHPYSRMGVERVASLADEVPTFFAETGITLKGSCLANHLHMTPLGILKHAWLTMNDYLTWSSDAPSGIHTCVIAGIKGFPDFYPGYISKGLEGMGISCRTTIIEIPEVERLRKSSGEMRASSIARILHGPVLEAFATELNKVSADADVVFIPAVVGFDSEEHLQRLRRMVARPLYCVPVTPMSVGGLRAQITLRRHFERLGGTYLLGDNAVRGVMDKGATPRMSAVETASLGEDSLNADTFVLATGGIFSRGIVAEPHRIYEPLLGLDVEAPADRDSWYNANFFASQPYMSYGVSTDETFRALLGGKPIENLYACGAVLGGCDALKEESGAGVAILTAMQVADNILAHKASHKI